MLYKLTALKGLNIRTDAGIENAIKVSGGIQVNDLIESGARKPASDGVMWYRIDKQTRAGVALTAGLGGWAAAGATGGYMRLDSVSETPAGLPDVLWIGETKETVQEYRKAA